MKGYGENNTSKNGGMPGVINTGVVQSKPKVKKGGKGSIGHVKNNTSQV